MTNFDGWLGLNPPKVYKVKAIERVILIVEEIILKKC
jgi:hypothetical protein